MRLFIATLALVIVGCGAPGANQSASDQSLPRLEQLRADDQIFPISVPSAFASVRGYLVVAETPGADPIREIRLPVIIVKAKSPDPDNPKPPVLRLAGGPGISGLNAAAYPGAYPWTAKRDFIILGQRGTQDADPALICDEYIDAIISEDSILQRQTDAASACRKRFTSQGINLSAYHSLASAKDIEALRQTLGIDELSLYGLSYGTRLALTYAREYPDRVASMVLDSPLPHTVSYDDESPTNYEAALRRVAELCALQPECNQAYPDLFGRFKAAIDDAKETPWQVETDDGVTREVSAADLAVMVDIGSDYAVASAPRIIDAIARRDIEYLRPLFNSTSAPTLFAWGMRLSVWCSEALPYSDRRRTDDSQKNFAGIDGAVVLPEVCEAWDVAPRPKSDRAETKASIPTLLIAGELDPLTPPAWANEAARTLSQSHVAIVPYGGHSETNNWGGDGCAMSIADAFFEDEVAFLQSADEKSGCLKERQTPDFVLLD